jgi:hypothetical protein
MVFLFFDAAPGSVLQRIIGDNVLAKSGFTPRTQSVNALEAKRSEAKPSEAKRQLDMISGYGNRARTGRSVDQSMR